MTSSPGNRNTEEIFCRAFAKGTLHHAWILAGEKGLGKSLFSKQAAHFLLSSENSCFAKDPNDQAANLLAAGSHPDFRLLRRGPKSDKEEKKARDNGLDSLEEHELARNIKVDQVRKLQSLLSNQASISKYRVVVIDSIDDLERNAANALLKNLEEPPKNTVFLLVSHAPSRLLPTIVSRCQMLRFERLNDGQMREILAEASPGLDETELTALIEAGEGAAGKALQYIDVNLAELEDIAKKIMETGDLDNGLKNDLARKLSLKAATKRYRAFVERAPTMIAGQIKAMAGSDKFQAIEIWQQANNLAAVAIPKALDSHAVVFRLAAMMGSLAQTDRRA